MLLMCLQAIPVLQFFSSERSFYVYVDEDKPEETKLKEKKEKECVQLHYVIPDSDLSLSSRNSWQLTALPSPYLESFTPPPNIAC